MTFSIRRVFIALSSLLLATVPFLASTPQAGAEFRQAPSSRVAIELGANFTPSDRFSGFVDKSGGASFVIIEQPAAAYEELKTMPDRKEALAAQGLSDTAKAELKGRDGTFVYLVGTQNTPNGKVSKFVLIFRDRDLTAMIIANVPQAAIEAGTYKREDIEKALATATVRDTPAAAAALFRFRDLGPFKEAFTIGGTTKAYNISGTRPHPGQNMMVREPMLLVSPSIDSRTVDPKAAARATFTRLGGMKEGEMDAEQDVTIGGLKGYQVTGQASDATTGDRIAIHLVLLAGQPSGYFLIVGTTPATDKDKMMPEIQQVIASFEPVK